MIVIIHSAQIGTVVILSVLHRGALSADGQIHVIGSHRVAIASVQHDREHNIFHAHTVPLQDGQHITQPCLTRNLICCRATAPGTVTDGVRQDLPDLMQPMFALLGMSFQLDEMRSLPLFQYALPHLGCSMPPPRLMFFYLHILFAAHP